MRNVPPTPGQQAEAARIAAELARLGFALPGTLTERPGRCRHPACRCHADPPVLHGPYHQWTPNARGNAATRLLSHDQLDDPRPPSPNHPPPPPPCTPLPPPTLPP